MIYFFMLAIFLGLIGVGVLALYLMDRVHKIEKQTVRTGTAGQASAAFGTTDPRFEGFGGQRLWELLTAPEGGGCPAVECADSAFVYPGFAAAHRGAF